MNSYKIYARKVESGQIIVIIAFLMIAMIAMLGLALDGGGLMFLQRDLQNATDTALLAATYAKCSGGTNDQVANAALSAAAEQGFEHGVNGVTITVDPDYIGDGDGEYVYISIQAPKETYFIQVVYNSPLNVTADGIGRCNEIETYIPTSNRAIFAACEGTSTGVEIQASSTCSGEIIGGLHSNSDAKSNSGMCGKGDISATGSTTALSGTYNDNPLPAEATSGVEAAEFPVVWTLDQFSSIGSEYATRIISAWGSDNFGILPGGLSMKVDEVPAKFASYGLADPTVEPVLVYVNGDITIKGGKGAGTMYMTIVATGQISFTGSIDDWNFVNAGQSPAGNWSSGASANGMDYLFLYSDRLDPHNGDCKAGGSTAIDFSINNGYWNGIIYAPNGDVTISASSSDTSYGAIWAQAIKFTVSGMTIEWDINLIPPQIIPPTIGIVQ